MCVYIYIPFSRVPNMFLVYLSREIIKKNIYINIKTHFFFKFWFDRLAPPGSRDDVYSCVVRLSEMELVRAFTTRQPVISIISFFSRVSKLLLLVTTSLRYCLRFLFAKIFITHAVFMEMTILLFIRFYLKAY